MIEKTDFSVIFFDFLKHIITFIKKFILFFSIMKLITKNKRAYFDYGIEKDYQAGIILKGFEAKAVKTSHINIQDAVVKIDKQELWLYNMDIPLYEKTSPILAPNYQPKARRKLLLNKREIAKIAAALDKPGMVLLALEVYIAKG